MPKGIIHFLACSADHVLSEPDPTPGIDEDADTDLVERRTGQVNAVSSRWRLVDHALLDGVNAAPGCWIRPGKADVLATIREVGEALIGNALVLRASIRAGMDEAAMDHIPAVQPCSTYQRVIPDKWVEATCSPVAIDQGKQLLGQLQLFRSQWRRGPKMKHDNASFLLFAGAECAKLPYERTECKEKLQVQ